MITHKEHIIKYFESGIKDIKDFKIFNIFNSRLKIFDYMFFMSDHLFIYKDLKFILKSLCSTHLYENYMMVTLVIRSSA